MLYVIVSRPKAIPSAPRLAWRDLQLRSLFPRTPGLREALQHLGALAGVELGELRRLEHEDARLRPQLGGCKAREPCASNPDADRARTGESDAMRKRESPILLDGPATSRLALRTPHWYRPTTDISGLLALRCAVRRFKPTSTAIEHPTSWCCAGSGRKAVRRESMAWFCPRPLASRGHLERHRVHDLDLLVGRVSRHAAHQQPVRCAVGVLDPVKERLEVGLRREAVGGRHGAASG